MKCIMCNCDYKSDKSLLEKSSYINLCQKMGYCGINCYNNIDYEDRCDIECNYLFKNLYKNINNKNIKLLYNKYGIKEKRKKKKYIVLKKLKKKF